ncbi:hypothetical protein TNCV_2887321 [Trichonephila clavipes]|nr:hypothetical protein TNCV_2887321 [Trichonephila clavipes]
MLLKTRRVVELIFRGTGLELMTRQPFSDTLITWLPRPLSLSTRRIFSDTRTRTETRRLRYLNHDHPVHAYPLGSFGRRPWARKGRDTLDLTKFSQYLPMPREPLDLLPPGPK